MNINDFIGEKAEKRLEKISRILLLKSPTFSSDLFWLREYIKFIKGNRRANQDGLD